MPIKKNKFIHTLRKKKQRVLGFMALFIAICTFTFPKIVYGAEDPAVGTASNEIENMLTVGKSLIGKTPYVWGGGHGDWNEQKDKDIPKGLDCSSFIAWALYRGMGIDIGLAPTSDNYGQYFDKIDTGSLDKAKRGDIVAGNGHIEFYLGKGDDGKHYSVHAANERQDITITEVNWGQGVSGKEILRVNLEDAKNGKNGLSYKPDVIMDGGVSGSGESTSEDSGTTVTKPASEEDLFSWLNPIVDFTGASNTHSQSNVEEKRIDGTNKGLKGHQQSIFKEIFGGL